MPEKQREYIPTYEEIKEAEGMMNEEQINLSAARAEELDRIGKEDSKQIALELTDHLIDQSKNFEYFSPKDRKLPEGFKEFAENILKKMQDYFSIEDMEKIKVTFFEFKKPQYGKGHMNHQRNLENTRIVFRKGYTEDKTDNEIHDKYVFTHELAHHLTGNWTGDKTHPAVTFLDEGFAEYMATKLFLEKRLGKKIDVDEKAVKWLKEYPEQKKYLSLSELPTNFEYGKFGEQKKGDDAFSQYYLGRSFISYIIENYSLEKLKNIMKKAINGADFWSMEKSDRQWMQDNMNRVFQEELGVSAEELMNRWAKKLEESKL